MTLAKKVYETVHRGRVSVEELADRLGCSSSLLYRAANPNDEAADLKLNWLIPLMETTKNYSILHHLANRLGFVLVKIPRARRMQPSEIAAHQRTLNEYVQALFDFADQEIERDQALEKINAALTGVAAARKMVEAYGPQADLFDEA